MHISLLLIASLRSIRRPRIPSSGLLASTQRKNHQNAINEFSGDGTDHFESFEGPGRTSLRRWGGTVLDECAPMKLFREAGRLLSTWRPAPNMAL